MKWTGSVCILLLLVAGLLFSECGGRSDSIDTVATPIAKTVSAIRIADKYYNDKVQLKTRLYYRAHEYKRAWLRKRRPDRMFNAFVREVRGSTRYGFHPRDYHIDELERDVESLYDNRKRTDADVAQLDISITASFFLFTTHLIEGRIRYPGAREFLWKRGMPLENDIALLLKMKSGADLRKELDNLHPQDPQYRRLQTLLEDYGELIPKDTFGLLPQGITINPGDRHTLIPRVRRKLSLTDFRKDEKDTSTVYDADLQKALQKFQERHGLEPNGVLKGETIKFLNQSVQQKTELIALNLERLRWHPHLKGKGDEIVINVPEYMLRIYRKNKEKLKMRVVLGAEYTPTPVFHDTLKYVVFSPTWMVPQSIFEKEFLPELMNDPGHFDPARFRIYKDGKEVDPYLEPWDDEDLDLSSYSVVESPGDGNSLGKVKFVMPNDFSIYLHDTPADQLFNRDERALSHGCIRLERPEEFAEYLLSDIEGWNEDRIKNAMQGKKPVQVALEKPFPVYIVYRTVWVDDQGLAHFRDDIYGHDRRQLAHLDQ